MASVSVKSATLALVVSSSILAAASLILSYQAGCTGDPKGGFGNVEAALKIQVYSVCALTLSLLIASWAIFLASRNHLSGRIANAVGYPLIAGTVLWIVGMQAESWATVSCLLKH